MKTKTSPRHAGRRYRTISIVVSEEEHAAVTRAARQQLGAVVGDRVNSPFARTILMRVINDPSLLKAVYADSRD